MKTCGDMQSQKELLRTRQHVMRKLSKSPCSNSWIGPLTCFEMLQWCLSKTVLNFKPYASHVAVLQFEFESLNLVVKVLRRGEI